MSGSVNVHVHLHVSDLEASRSFYQRFLGTEPVKLRPGYLKFLPGLAPINLALSAGQPHQGKNVDHLGFEVESRERVEWEIYHVNHDVDADGRRADQQTAAACCPPAPLARIGKRA
jgi:catechol 2,3-dioxygenase-like lactoylglutathione lyase family enzyme